MLKDMEILIPLLQQATDSAFWAFWGYLAFKVLDGAAVFALLVMGGHGFVKLARYVIDNK